MISRTMQKTQHPSRQPRLPRVAEKIWAKGVALVCGLSFALPGHAAMSSEELAKLARNPIANLISVPFMFPK